MSGNTELKQLVSMLRNSADNVAVCAAKWVVMDSFHVQNSPTLVISWVELRVVIAFGNFETSQRGNNHFPNWEVAFFLAKELLNTSPLLALDQLGTLKLATYEATLVAVPIQKCEDESMRRRRVHTQTMHWPCGYLLKIYKAANHRETRSLLCQHLRSHFNNKKLRAFTMMENNMRFFSFAYQQQY